MLQHSKEYYLLLPLKNNVIGIDGKIASGKSTLGKRLAEYLNKIGMTSDFFAECVNNDCLKLYCSNMKETAFWFQNNTLERRIVIHKNAESAANGGGVSIIDRSMYGDRAFAEMQRAKGFFTDLHWEIYNKTVEQAKVYEPMFILQLLCDAETAMDRVKIRDRSGEEVYDPAYLNSLEYATGKVLDECHHGVRVKLDWSHNLSKSGLHELSASGEHVVEITDEMCFEILMKLVRAYDEWRSCRSLGDK